MIPWVAGGEGDPLLAPADRQSTTDCQDGGFDPSSEPSEKREKAKEKSKKEIEAFEEATGEEKEKIEKAEALEGPHIQEPNQNDLPDGVRRRLRHGPGRHDRQPAGAASSRTSSPTRC